MSILVLSLCCPVHCALPVSTLKGAVCRWWARCPWCPEWQRPARHIWTESCQGPGQMWTDLAVQTSIRPHSSTYGCWWTLGTIEPCRLRTRQWSTPSPTCYMPRGERNGFCPQSKYEGKLWFMNVLGHRCDRLFTYYINTLSIKLWYELRFLIVIHTS